MINTKRTGKTRLQARHVKVGLFQKKIILVHQTQMTGEREIFIAGSLEYQPTVWWEDTKVGWLTEQNPDLKVQCDLYQSIDIKI